MNEDIFIEDESGDKKYFTMLPNYILNHSTAVDQALYCQLKKFAGENGIAYPSIGTLMSRLGIAKATLKKSFNYLIKRGWIKEAGKMPVQTEGGLQYTNGYKIVDIWKLNINHYEEEKGGQNRYPLSEGGSQRGVNRGGQNRPTNKNHLEEEPVNKEVAKAPANSIQDFFFMVKENGDKYSAYLETLKIPKDIARREINKFTLYWTEPNQSKTKERWQKEPTFEIKRRLITWFNNVKEFNKKEITNKYKAKMI